MKYLKTVFIVTGILLLISPLVVFIYFGVNPVDQANERYKQQRDSANMSLKTIYYFKDTNTNLCFAAWGNYWSNGMRITNVPCTIEVEARLER